MSGCGCGVVVVMAGCVGVCVCMCVCVCVCVCVSMCVMWSIEPCHTYVVTGALSYISRESRTINSI